MRSNDPIGESGGLQALVGGPSYTISIHIHMLVGDHRY